jgi:plastocyanin
MLTRRALLQAAGLWLAGVAAPPVAAAARAAGAAPAVEIRMRSDARGEQVWFDPVGVRIEPGQTVRWLMVSPGNPHTTTAYHPENAKHSLRIPEAAVPWDSGFLLDPGDRFEVTLTVEGVYDYFCLPHEAAGMVGRIVVGRPGGPGARPFDYFVGQPGAADWQPVPAAARTAFPSVEAIVARGAVTRR